MTEEQSILTGKLPDTPLYQVLNAITSLDELDIPSSIVVDIIMRIFFNEQGRIGV